MRLTVQGRQASAKKGNGADETKVEFVPWSFVASHIVLSDSVGGGDVALIVPANSQFVFVFLLLMAIV